MTSFLEYHISFEMDSKILYNETIISFTKLLVNHSAVLNDSNEIDLENGLLIWFESIQYLLNNKKNSIVFDFLSFLLRNKTEDVLMIFGPTSHILLILDKIGSEAVSDENKDLFVSFIRQYLSAEGSPFGEDELDEYKKLKLQKILNS